MDTFPNSGRVLEDGDGGGLSQATTKQRAILNTTPTLTPELASTGFSEIRTLSQSIPPSSSDISGSETTSTAPSSSDIGTSVPRIASAPSGNSLSPGAIAGIAVGGAVAIIVIAALIWFCIYRRRNKHEPAYEPHYKSNTIMEDKAFAAAQVANSRQSGYSQDSGRREYPAHNAIINPTGVAHHDDGIDHRSHPLITIPIPKNVSHYVEDHHTNADLERIIREENIIQHDINAANPTHATAEER